MHLIQPKSRAHAVDESRRNVGSLYIFLQRSPCPFPSHPGFFPNDLRCGFRKLKERGVGDRTSGAALVPKSLLLLLLILLCPRSRPRPDFTYTKNLRYQNLHGMDLHGQSDLSPSCFGPRVAFFAEPEPWAYKQSTFFFHFLKFLIFYSCQLCFCLCLPGSHFFQNERRGPTNNRRVLQFL